MRLRSFSLMALLGLVVLLGSAATSHAQRVDTLRCAGGDLDTLDMGLMVLGEYRDTVLYIVNESATDSIALGTTNGTRLRLHDTGIRSLIHTTAILPLTVYADAVGTIRGDLTYQPLDTCQALSTQPVVARVQAPVQDSAMLPLLHAATAFIAMKSTRDSEGVYLRLLNNSTDTLTLRDVYVRGGTRFHVKVLNPLPNRVAPGAYLEIVLSLLQQQVGSVSDSLIIVPIEPTNTESYALVGYRTDSAAVHAQRPTTHSWSVDPNPSKGLLHLSSATLRATKVEVLDVLGHVLSTFTPSMMDRVTLDLRSLDPPAGTYFLRVESSDDRNTYTETVRIAIE